MKFKFVNGKMIILEATQRLNEAEPATSTATAAGTEADDLDLGPTSSEVSAVTLPKNLTELAKLDPQNAEDLEKIKLYIQKIERDNPNNTRWLNELYGMLLVSKLWKDATVRITDKDALKYTLAEMVKQKFQKVEEGQVPLVNFLKNLAIKRPNYSAPYEVIYFINKSEFDSDILKNIGSDIYTHASDIFGNSTEDTIFKLKLFLLLSDKNKIDQYGLPADKKFNDLVKLSVNELETFLARYTAKDDREYLKDWLKAQEKEATFAVLRDFIQNESKISDADKKAWLDPKVGILGENNIEALSNKSNPRAKQVWNIQVRTKDTFVDVFNKLKTWYESEDVVDDGKDLSLNTYLTNNNIKNVPDFLRKALNNIQNKTERDLYLQKLFVILSDDVSYKNLLKSDVVADDFTNSLITQLKRLSVPNREITFEKALAASGLTGEQGYGKLKEFVNKGVTNQAAQTKLNKSIDLIFDKKNPGLKADFLKSIVPLTKNGTFDWLKGLQNYVARVKKNNGIIDK